LLAEFLVLAKLSLGLKLNYIYDKNGNLGLKKGREREVSSSKENNQLFKT
jgi:hypothetical protein